MKAKIKPQSKRNVGRPKFSKEKKLANKIAKDKFIDDEAKAIEASADGVIAAARTRRKEAREAHANSGGLQGQRLVAPQREGFKRRFVNDDNKGNIDKHLRLGYYFLEETQIGDEYIPTSDLGKRKSQRVGTKEDGSELIGYLMEIPLEFYQETQNEKEARIVALESQVRQGNAEGGVENSYDPQEEKGGNNNFNI